MVASPLIPYPRKGQIPPRGVIRIPLSVLRHGAGCPGLAKRKHIVPWSKDERNRLNPHNELCLNVPHHRAFDLGLMTITPDGVIRISSDLRASARKSERAAFVAERDGEKIETSANLSRPVNS